MVSGARIPRVSRLYVAQFQFVDCFDFIHRPNVGDSGMWPCSAAVAEYAIRAAGYVEDSMDLGLIWLPPFLWRNHNVGVCLWHCKQWANGVSWLCSAAKHNFAGFEDTSQDPWKLIDVPTSSDV